MSQFFLEHCTHYIHHVGTSSIPPVSCQSTLPGHVIVYRAKTSKPKKDSEPGDGIMSMLRNLYDEGDDDMKRTLAKAWTEVQEKRKKGGNDDMEMPKL